MAHIGKTYELLTRRDLCLGCRNHRAALPKDFHVNWQGIFNSSPAKNFTVAAQQLFLTSDPWSSSPTWESAAISQHGLTFTIKASMLGFNQQFQITRVEFDWMNGGVSRLHCRPAQTVPGRCDQFMMGTFDGGVSYTGLDPWFWSATVATCSGAAVPWHWND